MANPIEYVDPPVRAERRGGIKTVAEFIENKRIGMGINPQYSSEGCAFPVDDIALCYTGGTQNQKTPNGIATLDATVGPFGLYSAVKCWMEGGDFESEAAALLAQGEDRMIEKRLNTWIQSVAASATVTGGNLQEALARAEAKADLEYLGAPVILVNRGDAVRIGALNFDNDEGITRTKNGSLVISSGAFTAGTVSVVGALTVVHTPVVATRAITPAYNTEIAIAERVYAVLVDCDYAIRFAVTA